MPASGVSASGLSRAGRKARSILRSSTGRFIRSSISRRRATVSCSASMPARFRIGCPPFVEAKETREVTRTRPLRLVQSPEASALLLYAPIFDENGRFLGVMGFGFKIDEFFRAALATAQGAVPARPSASIRTTSSEPLFSLRPGGSARNQSVRRQTLFRAQDGFRPQRSELRLCGAARSGARSISARLVGGGARAGDDRAAAVRCSAYVSNRAAALSDEVAQRRSAEDRLKVLIHELNHRVRNVMSVAQAVVRLSFTPGLSLCRYSEDLRRASAGFGARRCRC